MLWVGQLSAVSSRICSGVNVSPEGRVTFPPNVAVRIAARKARSLGSVISGAPVVLLVVGHVGWCPYVGFGVR